MTYETTEGHAPATPEESTVPVAGGRLAVLRWPATDPGAPVVLAVHGITANALSWGPVARQLAGRVTLIAPTCAAGPPAPGFPARTGSPRTPRTSRRSPRHWTCATPSSPATRWGPSWPR